VWRYTPDAVVDRTIDLPVRLVTSCAFGGAELDDLYITTASWGLDAATLPDQPHAGAVFVARPGVRGLPPTPFAGTRAG
jgi:sugar lactone lactonase YvrE